MTWSGFVCVGLGAAIGAWGRWVLGVFFNAIWPMLPMGTLLANLIGGYCMGVVMGVTTQTSLTEEMRLFLATGFLGGLTTFSTFSAESVGFLTRAEYGWWGMHMALHVLGSILMTMLGVASAHMLKA